LQSLFARSLHILAGGIAFSIAAASRIFGRGTCEKMLRYK
jgi:hypothetical protein